MEDKLHKTAGIISEWDMSPSISRAAASVSCWLAGRAGWGSPTETSRQVAAPGRPGWAGARTALSAPAAAAGGSPAPRGLGNRGWPRPQHIWLWQRSRGLRPSQPPSSDEPPQMAEPIRQRSRLSLCFIVQRELRGSSDFYGTSKGNN